MKNIIEKRLAFYQSKLLDSACDALDKVKYNLLINELNSLLSEKFYEDSLEKIDIRYIDISNRKEVEMLIRNNRLDILESEELIVHKLYEGINIGLYRKNKLIGYLLGSFDYEKELYYNERAVHLVNDLNCKSVFIISDLLIDKKSRRNGHASFLLERLLNLCDSELILFLGRNESNGKVWRAKNLGLRLGFLELCKIPNFWFDSSVLEDFMCLSCHSFCHCEMELLYFKNDGSVFKSKDLNELSVFI